ncbi:hypothetical protein HG530_013103 [Fusarium avenaceum]|nr:hypothetical protein HG530_013103 [Fusarium avenaceum]KIL84585.1 hypothetical protein FAVG1_12111 [Fusarium avenaceum]
MHYATILAALSFGIGAQAWAQSGNGEWIANDTKYYGFANALAAFEACTYMNTNNLVPVGNGCRFWTNGQGGIHYGACRDISGHTGTVRQCI